VSEEQNTGGGLSRREVIRAASGAALAGVGVTALGLGTGRASPPVAASPAPRMRLVDGTTQLLIADGSPHWHSPDIWVVPGDDPNGPPGPPVAGGTAYVYARVTNIGEVEAIDTQVRFYWGDPSAQLFFSTMNPIGTAFATIPAGQHRDVLCATPWNVILVNSGHECLVVTAQLPGDAALPDQVDWTYQNVAQRNLSVVYGPPPGKVFSQALTVRAPRTGTIQARLTATVGGALPAQTLASLGLRQRTAVTAPVVAAGLSRTPVAGGNVGQPVLTTTVPAGQSLSVYVAIAATAALGPDEYQVVTVTQQQGGAVVGGVSFVVAAVA